MQYSHANPDARKADSSMILINIMVTDTSSTPEPSPDTLSSGKGKKNPLHGTRMPFYLALPFFPLPSHTTSFFPLKALENTLKSAEKPSKKERAVILVKTRNFSILLNHLELQGQRSRSDGRLVSSYPSCEQIALWETIPLALA